MTSYSPDQAARTLPLTARLDRAPRKRDHRVRRGETCTSLRLLDVAIGSVGLCLALPLLALISLAIALERTGPILFRQVRVGSGGRLFRMIKFRTMALSAERGTGAVWATPDDPRATRVGSFLRRSHLDELPQLWNVIRGEMSLVGPRPERPEFVRELQRAIPNYMDRCGVSPGITGLAQLRVGYDTSLATVRRKVRYDRLYIRRQCIRLYAAILVRTAVQLAMPYAFGPTRLIRAAARRAAWLVSWRRRLAPGSSHVGRDPILRSAQAQPRGFRGRNVPPLRWSRRLPPPPRGRAIRLLESSDARPGTGNVVR